MVLVPSRIRVRHVRKANLIVLDFLLNIYLVSMLYRAIIVFHRPTSIQQYNPECRRGSLLFIIYSLVVLLIFNSFLFSFTFLDTNCTYMFHATPNEQVTIVFDHFKVKADGANATGGAYG